MNLIKESVFEGERALYNIERTRIETSTFQNGESPLKECNTLVLDACIFKWKYPLWYCDNIDVRNTTLLETARSGIWYTNNIRMENCFIEAPKTFRRAGGITLINCRIPKAQETFWNCHDIKLSGVDAVGDYFAMNSKNIEIENFTLDGNYAFDGAENVVIRGAKLLSKDSFWNTKNVTVYDSLIVGEYLGWNSENVTLINCTVDSNQGMCYMKNLKMVNCRLLNTDLAFEFSSVDADINSKIISVKNPIEGKISANAIDEIILDDKLVDPKKTSIIIKKEECAD